MKLKFSALILSLFILPCHAMEVDCYSGHENIYHGIGRNVLYGDGFLFFDEASSGKTVYVNADCVVKYYKQPAKKKHK